MKQERINVRDIIHAQKQAAKSVHNSQKFSDFEKRMLMRKSTVKSQVVDAEQPANLPENDLDDLGLEALDDVADDFTVTENKDLQDCCRLKVLDVDVEPLQINNITDKHGVLSNKIEEFMSQYGTAVVPLSAIGITSTLSSLERFDILEVDGVCYAMNRKPRENYLSIYKRQILDALEAGKTFCDSLLIKINCGIEEVITLNLSQIEWSYVCTWFSNYNAAVTVRNHDVVLTVGS